MNSKLAVSRAKRLAFEALMQASREAFQAAPVVATFAQYHDTYDRSHARSSVELCHGTWTTFSRMYAGSESVSVKGHESREAARSFAKAWVTGL